LKKYIVEEIYTFLKMDKKEKIKKKFNLTFIDDIKEFDYYTVKLINKNI